MPHQETHIQEILGNNPAVNPNLDPVPEPQPAPVVAPSAPQAPVAPQVQPLPAADQASSSLTLEAILQGLATPAPEVPAATGGSSLTLDAINQTLNPQGSSLTLDMITDELTPPDTFNYPFTHKFAQEAADLEAGIVPKSFDAKIVPKPGIGLERSVNDKGEVEPGYLEAYYADFAIAGANLATTGISFPLLFKEKMREREKLFEEGGVGLGLSPQIAEKTLTNVARVAKGIRFFLPEALEPQILHDVINFEKAISHEKRSERFKNIAKDPGAAQALENLAIAEAAIREATLPGIDPFSFKGISGAVIQAGVGNVAPMIGISLVAGPKVGMSFFATQAFAIQFRNSTVVRRRGLEESIADGYFSAVAEAVPEAFVVGALLKPGLKIFKRIGLGFMAESAQEVFTEILTIGHDMGVFDEKVTVSEAIGRMIHSGLVGGIIGSGMAAGFHPSVVAAEKRAAQTRKTNKETLSRSLGSNIVDPGGPNLTRGEKVRLQILQSIEAVAKASANPESSTTASPEILKMHEAIKVELADLQMKAGMSIDEGGQLVIPGISLADIASSKKLTAPQPIDVAFETPRPENAVAPTSVNDHVDFQGLSIETAEIDLDPLLYNDQLTAQRGWVNHVRPEALEQLVEVYSKDVNYQLKFHELLDIYFPDSDTILMYRGHSPDRAAYGEEENARRIVGSASLNPVVAMSFAAANTKASGLSVDPEQSAAYANAIVSVVEVPKALIKANNVSIKGEAEFFFELKEGVKYRGSFHFLDYRNGLQQNGETTFGIRLTKFRQTSTAPNVHELLAAPNVLKGQRLPLIQEEPGGQATLPGFAPKTVAPEQLDFNGHLEESQDDTQKHLNLGASPTILLGTGNYTIVPGTQRGTRGGQVYEHKQSGTRYFIKIIGDVQARNELAASKLYELFGINVAPLQLVIDENGKTGIASRMVEGAVELQSAEKAKGIDGLLEGFVVDAWLANHDVIGLNFDNIVLEHGPLGDRAIRIDQGAALLFRAGGESKTSFRERVTELVTMRDDKAGHRTSVQVFKDVTDEQVAEQAAIFSKVTEEQIEKVLKEFGPRDFIVRDQLLETLLKRRVDILERFPPPQGAVAPKSPGPAPGSTKRVGLVNDPIAKAVLAAGKQRGGPPIKDAHGEKAENPAIVAKRAKLEMDRFSWWVKTSWTILQLVIKNPHIPGLGSYAGGNENLANSKMDWIVRADERVRDWQHLGKPQSDALSEVLFDYNAMTYLKEGKVGKKEEARMPTEEELVELFTKHGLQAEAIEMFFVVNQDMGDFLNSLEEIQIAEARRILTDPLALEKKIKSITEGMEKLRSRPYFPVTRYGKHTIVIRDSNDNVVYVETFENIFDNVREKRFQELKKIYTPEGKDLGFIMRKDIISDEINQFRSLPATTRDEIVKLMGLDVEKQDKIEEADRKKKLRELEEVLYEQSDINSFVKHFERRKLTPGYHRDALRNYADYFLRGANHLARVKHVPELDAAIKEMEDEAKLLKNIPFPEIEKRRGIITYVKDHREFIVNPKNDLAQVRALGFVWFIGFVPKSAVVNLTQVPLVALPYLSSRFNDAAAVTELARAMKDVKGIYQNKLSHRMTDQKLRAINLLIQQGILDESQAMELAAMSGGSYIQRVLPGNKVQRAVREVQYASAWMFQSAEKYNRRVVASAAWELALKNPDTEYLQDLMDNSPGMVRKLEGQGWEQEHIRGVLAMKDAVSRTQYEYASWNRPRFMRGKASVVFLFFQYLQNTMWFFANSPGRGRALLTLLMVGGLSGLPFAEDITTLVKAFGRRFDKDWDAEKAVREYITEIGAGDPDWYLHGASRNSFGLAAMAEMLNVPFPNFDLSGSLSFGKVVPGVDFFEPGDFGHKFLRGSTDAGGAVMSGVMGMVQAMMDTENIDSFKRWERAMPSFMKNGSKAARRVWRGGEQTKLKAFVGGQQPLDARFYMENAMQALGFAPTSQAIEFDRARMQREGLMFWALRSKHLKDTFFSVMLAEDPEGIADVTQAITKYQNEVPYPEMGINMTQLRQSFREKKRRKLLEEFGLPPSRRNLRFATGINRLFPGSTQQEGESNIDTIGDAPIQLESIR